MEPLENIIPVCKECADERLKEFQRLNPELVLKPGQYVKLAFKDGIETEHMWVIVRQNKEDGLYSGELNNDPILVKNVGCGDLINFTINEVEQLIEK